MQWKTTTGREKRDFAQASGVRVSEHTAYPRGHRNSRAALFRSVNGASKFFFYSTCYTLANCTPCTREIENKREYLNKITDKILPCI